SDGLDRASFESRRYFPTGQYTPSWSVCPLLHSPISPNLWIPARGITCKNLAFPPLILFSLQEEEIPELEIDVDELLDMESDESRSARVKELLVDCYKPTEVFVADLLDKIRGMQKLSTPQKK
ncbi:protein phosphatase 1 regulatory subunit 14B, partial [Pantherophis guttatus]|uniref:Protein phosphatase 1 regulatory subunit 14B n=1 Tax=Pantherophis guttatus TaxID=94885 RepID=A0A6P9CNY5_PANGU